MGPLSSRRSILSHFPLREPGAQPELHGARESLPSARGSASQGRSYLRPGFSGCRPRVSALQKRRLRHEQRSRPLGLPGPTSGPRVRRVG